MTWVVSGIVAAGCEVACPDGRESTNMPISVAIAAIAVIASHLELFFLVFSNRFMISSIVGRLEGVSLQQREAIRLSDGCICLSMTPRL